MKYRKRPVIIEAIQWTGDNMPEILSFCGTNLIWGSGKSNDVETDFRIDTLEGFMNVKRNDFIVKGIVGEFYPCKPDIFEKTYEQIESE